MGRMVFTMIAGVAEFEREIIRERVIAGVRRAQAQGKHCGRKRVELDLRPAVAMLDKGHGIKTTARSLGVSVSTLRRRLREAGHWPCAIAQAKGFKTPPPKRRLATGPQGIHRGDPQGSGSGTSAFPELGPDRVGGGGVEGQ
jgi:hypothetical protein